MTNYIDDINKIIVEYFSKKLQEIKIKNIINYEKNAPIHQHFGTSIDLAMYLRDELMCDLLGKKNLFKYYKGEPLKYNLSFESGVYISNQIHKYYLQNEGFYVTMDMFNMDWVLNMYGFIVIRNILNDCNLADYAEITDDDILEYADGIITIKQLVCENKIFQKIGFIVDIWKKFYKEHKLFGLNELFTDYINLRNKKKTITNIFKNVVCDNMIDEILTHY